jgi:excisionase family DNA binding protein
VAVVSAPALIVTPRDGRWLSDVLIFLLERRYFVEAPDVEERALALVDELRQLLDSERQLGDALLSLRQAAQVMDCSLRTVTRRVADGSLPIVEFGRVRRVRRSDLERLGDR